MSSARDLDQEEWDYVDAHVFTWIYGTISRDLMTMVVSPGDSAKTTRNKIWDIFQDNKATQAIYLEVRFSHTNMANFMMLMPIVFISKILLINLLMWMPKARIIA